MEQSFGPGYHDQRRNNNRAVIAHSSPVEICKRQDHQLTEKYHLVL